MDRSFVITCGAFKDTINLAMTAECTILHLGHPVVFLHLDRLLLLLRLGGHHGALPVGQVVGRGDTCRDNCRRLEGRVDQW